MTKRLLALLLMCILAIPILAVSASATTVVEDVYSEEIYNNILGISDDVYSIEEYMRFIYNRYFELTLSGWTQNVNSWYNTVVERLNSIYLTLNGIDAVIKEECGKIVLKIGDFITSVGNHFDSLKSRISSEFEYLTDNLATWFDKQTSAIVSAIDSVIHGNAEKQPDVDDLGDEVDQQETQFQENMDVIQEATRPNYENLDLSIDAIIDPYGYMGGYDYEYGYALGRMVNNSLTIYTILFMSVMLSLVSFVIFGKR